MRKKSIICSTELAKAYRVRCRLSRTEAAALAAVAVEALVVTVVVMGPVPATQAIVESHGAPAAVVAAAVAFAAFDMSVKCA